MRKVLFLSVMLGLSFNSFAKSVKYSAPHFDKQEYWLPEVNEDAIIKRIKTSEKKRKPANSMMVDESMMSSELKSIEKRIHAIKTSEEYSTLFAELNEKYDTYPKDVQFYIAQVLPMKAFRGIFYRVRPLFERNSKFIHSNALTFVKSLSAKANIYLPYEHVDAAYQFVSSPYYTSKDSLVGTFSSEQEVQTFVAKEIIPLIRLSAQRLEKLDLTEPVVWDQRILYGKDTFQDGINRFKLIGELEKNIALSAVYGTLSQLSTVMAYNLSNTLKMYKDVGVLFGFDGFGLFNTIDGVSAEKVSRVIRKSEYQQTGTLLEGGKEWMMFAYQASQKSVKRMNLAWEQSSTERKEEGLYMANTGFFNVSREKVNENINIINRVVFSSGVETLRSAVTGEMIQLNYSELYKNPPMDLKAFLPTRFEKESKVSRKVSSGVGMGQTLTYRNYSEGTATSYNLQTFKSYVPSIKTQDDVYRSIRVLSHIQGNWLTLR
ncbi:MAG: hypothetical protein WC635_04550 [Bacteriovorax sp.]